MTKMQSHSNGHFQQANAASYKGIMVVYWLLELSNEFSVLKWPPSLSDLF